MRKILAMMMIGGAVAAGGCGGAVGTGSAIVGGPILSDEGGSAQVIGCADALTLATKTCRGMSTAACEHALAPQLSDAALVAFTDEWECVHHTNASVGTPVCPDEYAACQAAR